MTFLIQSPPFLGDYIYNFIKIWKSYISYSILDLHNYKNIQYYKKKLVLIFLFNTFIVKWVFFFIFTLIVSVKYLEIMIFACVFHPIFICDLCTCLPFFICDLFICAFVFHPWLGTLHWKHKRYQNLKNAIWNKQ